MWARGALSPPGQRARGRAHTHTHTLVFQVEQVAFSEEGECDGDDDARFHRLCARVRVGWSSATGWGGDSGDSPAWARTTPVAQRPWGVWTHLTEGDKHSSRLEQRRVAHGAGTWKLVGLKARRDDMGGPSRRPGGCAPPHPAAWPSLRTRRLVGWCWALDTREGRPTPGGVAESPGPGLELATWRLLFARPPRPTRQRMDNSGTGRPAGRAQHTLGRGTSLGACVPACVWRKVHESAWWIMGHVCLWHSTSLRSGRTHLGPAAVRRCRRQSGAPTP